MEYCKAWKAYREKRIASWHPIVEAMKEDRQRLFPNHKVSYIGPLGLRCDITFTLQGGECIEFFSMAHLRSLIHAHVLS